MKLSVNIDHVGDGLSESLVAASTPRDRVLELLTLERPADRLLLGLSLITLTLVSPNISLPGSLPALRLEQLALLVALVPLLRLHRRHAEFRRLGIVDAGFLALAVATAATIVLAPIFVPAITRSLRDGFELVRIAEYWLLFRIGLTIVPAGIGAVRIASVMAVAAIVLGAFAVLQYLNPPGFNSLATAFWTQSHNLDGVIREGRAVGTAGNANQFGVLAVFLLFVALAGRIGGPLRTSRSIWIAAVILSVMSLFLAQSRGAILGAAVGLVVALVLLAFRRTVRRGLFLAPPLLAVGIAAVFALVIIAPPTNGSGSILSRFNIAGILRDPSVVARVARSQSIFTDPGAGAPDANTGAAACATDLAQVSAPEPGHEPGSASPPAAPGDDVGRLANAVAAYYCATRVWPSDIAHDLVPVYLPVLPGGSGADAYSLYSSPRGFAVGVGNSVENRSEAPGAGSLPNLLANSSFEQPGNPPDQWLTSPGVITAESDASSAFSQSAVDVSMPRDGAIYQLVVADLPTSSVFTTGVWARSLDSNGSTLQLYIVATTASGARIEPLASRATDVTGAAGWQHLALSFQTPTDHLFSLQLMVRAPRGPAHVLLDGATLTEGPFALPYGGLVDRPASDGSGSGSPVFRESPILGVGPQKDEAVAVLDNEYTSFLLHYGILGLFTYLTLFAIAFAVGVRAAFRDRGWGGMLALSLAAFTIALGVAAISGGAFHQLQIMFIYWLIVGVAAAAASGADSERRVVAANPT